MAQGALILNGKALAKLLRRKIKEHIAKAVSDGNRPPGLGVILVGDNPASKSYVATKEKMARAVGMASEQISLPDSATQREVRDKIEELNAKSEIDGILLQLPLPQHLSADELLCCISPQKDSDGLHPLNQGRLMVGADGVRPCTPMGVMKLVDLAYSGAPLDEIKDIDEIKAADLAGKRSIVIGRSALVGKPVALMLLERNATVTIAHSKTADLPDRVSEADIVVSAVGRPFMIKGEWIKEGATVIDVGINRIESGALVGDVDFEAAKERAGAITPVPGGVGPMTVAMLLFNTFSNYRRNCLKNGGDGG
ncbi:MAG: bifunctional methylenetetrahydrofolate dehydrogenase/methenyltetrahydrofolate cyclohydrolase FolD [Candidatus Dadabacteria bacterium]|nr:MAG: bifunctional methylenetetrahydrofolate dehydrogenase/methenyltetrahydrofolate cyclohydrolase FolD [Candidatus Dadabacteria bacterium]